MKYLKPCLPKRSSLDTTILLISKLFFEIGHEKNFHVDEIPILQYCTIQLYNFFIHFYIYGFKLFL